MNNLSIESFFVVHSIESLYPLSEFISTGVLGSLFYVDFYFPFQLNGELLSQIQEKTKTVIKEGKKWHVFEMLPKVAKDFLHHHHQKKVAEKINLDCSMVSVIQIHDTYYVSENEVSHQNPSCHLKLLQFKPFLSYEGKTCYRLYGVIGKEQKELKEQVKKFAPFLKRDVGEKLKLDKFVGESQGSGFLREKGVFFSFELLQRFKEIFAVFDLEIALGSDEIEEGAFTWLNHDFSTEYEGPFADGLLEEFNQPLFHANLNLKKELIEEKFKKFFQLFHSWLKQNQIEPIYQVSLGEDFSRLAGQVFPLESIKRSKNKKRCVVQIYSCHFLGLRKQLLSFQAEEKEGIVSIKMEVLFQIIGLLAWLFDAKFYQSEQ
jgi:hypothetical protein